MLYYSNCTCCKRSVAVHVKIGPSISMIKQGKHLINTNSDCVHKLHKLPLGKKVMLHTLLKDEYDLSGQ